MLAHELKAREAKLRGEQAERSEKEKQRLEKERILKERQRQRNEQREEEKAKLRQRQLQAELKAQERMESLTEHNNGVYWSTMLQAVPSDETAIAARGIKRASDKVSLPPSVGAFLMGQDAPRNGALLFEITTPGGSTTHAGLLEFTAPEGIISLPRKVADCLWGKDVPVNGPVTVTYKRLDKGSFVSFQPLTRGFHDIVSEHIREVLEKALMQSTTLTEGDIITVVCSSQGEPVATSVPPAQGQIMDENEKIAEDLETNRYLSFDLLVQKLQPCTAVSLIDTDMEAQVVPSLETEQALQKMEEEKQYIEEQRQERERLALEALRQLRDEEQLLQTQRDQQHQEEILRRAQVMAALASSLPPEPSDQEQDEQHQRQPHVAVVFRMPDGNRSTRRFLLSDPACLLFHFCDSRGAGGWSPGTYRLVMQYPRRVVEPGSRNPLSEVGIVAGQPETMMLELIECTPPEPSVTI